MSWLSTAAAAAAHPNKTTPFLRAMTGYSLDLFKAFHASVRWLPKDFRRRSTPT